MTFGYGLKIIFFSFAIFLQCVLSHDSNNQEDYLSGKANDKVEEGPLSSLEHPSANNHDVGRSLQSSPQNDLNYFRNLWSQSGIDDYVLDIRRVCFCPPELTSPKIVTVTNNNIVSVTTRDGRPATPTAINLVGSVIDLFGIIQDAINRNADLVDVEYDATFGFPRDIVIDNAALVADDEFQIIVESFMPTQDGGGGGGGGRFAAQQAELSANRALWESQGIFEYEYTFQRSCFCDEFFRLPRTVRVINDSIVSVQPNDASVPSITDLFDRIQTSINDNVADVRVTYDPFLGYPLDVAIDFDAQLVDEEFYATAKIQLYKLPCTC